MHDQEEGEIPDAGERVSSGGHASTSSTALVRHHVTGTNAQLSVPSC